ncbi:hypothetical protein G6F43_009324 [Rhizopus delemar]|nr:hypothetical protein G6F43_009324 [Rhizopus delemar]
MDPDCSPCEGLFGFDALACAMERFHWNRIAFVGQEHGQPGGSNQSKRIPANAADERDRELQERNVECSQGDPSAVTVYGTPSSGDGGAKAALVPTETSDGWKRIFGLEETNINRFHSDGHTWAWIRLGESLKSQSVKMTVQQGGGSIRMWRTVEAK